MSRRIRISKNPVSSHGWLHTIRSPSEPDKICESELTKQDIVRFSTGCNSLDNLLDDRIEADVTQVYMEEWVSGTNCYFVCDVDFRIQRNLH